MLSAQILAPGQMEMRQIEPPEAGPGEVVIRVEAALTCGTDLKTFRRGHPKFPFPFSVGHEYSGVITQVGPGVERFHVGQAVMGVHSAPCRTCRLCRRGFPNLCETIVERMAMGAFAQYYRVPALVVEQNLYPRPDHVSAERGAFLEPLACVVQGQSQVPLQADDTVVVMGCGTIGLLHTLLARQRGAGRLIVTGKHRQRLELARQLGADHVIDVVREDVRERVQQLTDGRGAELVVECVGRPEAWEEAVDHAGIAGFVLFFGGCPSRARVSLDTTRIHYEQITMKGVFHFTPADVAEAYRLLCQTDLPVEKILSGEAILNEFPKVIADLDAGRGIKYLIRP